MTAALSVPAPASPGAGASNALADRADTSAKPPSVYDEAVLTLRPIQFSRGPNFWTVSVPGWSINAPTVREVLKLTREWAECEDMSLSELIEAATLEAAGG